jgi:hypothetical protein
VFTYERIFLHCSFKRHQRYLKSSSLTPRCAKHSPVCTTGSFTPRCAGHRRVSLPGVQDTGECLQKLDCPHSPVSYTAEFHSPVSCTPPSFTPRCPAHRRVSLPGVLHTAKFHSPVCRTPGSVCDSFGFLTPWCPV